jgi:hypothetical protein
MNESFYFFESVHTVGDKIGMGDIGSNFAVVSILVG